MNHSSSSQSGKQPATNDQFLASLPPLTANSDEVRAWLFTWFSANYLFLDPEGAPQIKEFLAKVRLTGRDIRNLDKVGLHKYFNGRNGGFQHKDLLEGLAADIQTAKGLELEKRNREKQRSWKEKVDKYRGRWIAIGGAGLGTPLAMHLWL